MKIYNNILELIGNTPLVKLNKLSQGCYSDIYLKLEYFNPMASVKDRIGLAMIEDAEKKGLLNKDSVIVEPTSGNTGIGLAYVAAVKGYKVILTMPETMSIERQKLLKALGADLVLTDGTKGMNGAILEAEKIQKNTKNSFMPQQFNNPANAEIHRKTTAEEIWKDTDGEVDIFIAGVGTGGTITGVGEVLKSKKSSVKIIAVEPSSSAVLSGEKAGPHKIQGIGAGFIPNILNKDIIDEIYKATEEEASCVARRAAKEEGIMMGISSGAILSAAIHYGRMPENSGKKIVCIVCDTGERYLSTWLFDN